MGVAWGGYYVAKRMSFGLIGDVLGNLGRVRSLVFMSSAAVFRSILYECRKMTM